MNGGDLPARLRSAYRDLLDVADRAVETPPRTAPPAGEWDVGQLLAHLVAVDAGVLAAAWTVVAGGRAGGAGAGRVACRAMRALVSKQSAPYAELKNDVPDPRPRPDEELRGLVYALTPRQTDAEHSFWRRPTTLGVIVLITTLALNFVFF